ncbi:ATP synthase protein I2 [Microbacterium esteraromaticum]|uniref:ATP synthase protein I2 n=1 Tax=Microbacterium esteraromaticum TaxID=57043 RepID=A0A1R4JII1_9MICO|nr:ATP synthase protein I2 [Microbacterium esteraromaticum]
MSSTPILRRTLIWSAIAALVLAMIAGGIGFAVAGVNGLWSGLIGVLLSMVFLGVTAASILFANRWFGDPIYVQIFFAVVLGGWLLKIVIFIVAMLLIGGQPWVVPMILFLSIIAGVAVSLVVDAVVLMRMRLPNVSDIELPTTVEDES